MAQNKVVKCICHNKMFDEIKDYAEKNNISTIEELQKRNYCSNSCRMCTPYVEMVLKTGQTEYNPGEPFR